MSSVAGIRVTPATVDVVERAEGYLEFRCTPASWSYDPAVEVAALSYELESRQRGEDPMGWAMKTVTAGEALPLPMSGAPGRWYRWSALRQWDRWPRRQDVEREGTTSEPGPLLLFVSHRWESADHPDPTGGQLRTLTAGLTVALAAAVGLDHPEQHRSASGLPELLGRFMSARRGDDWRDDPELQGWAQQVVSVAKRVKSPAALMSSVAPWRRGASPPSSSRSVTTCSCGSTTPRCTSRLGPPTRKLAFAPSCST